MSLIAAKFVMLWYEDVPVMKKNLICSTISITLRSKSFVFRGELQLQTPESHTQAPTGKRTASLSHCKLV